MNSSLAAEFLERGYQLPNRAAAELAIALMEGDAASHKAGYTRPNAIMAALEVFPQASRESVEKLVP